MGTAAAAGPSPLCRSSVAQRRFRDGNVKRRATRVYNRCRINRRTPIWVSCALARKTRTFFFFQERRDKREGKAYPKTTERREEGEGGGERA